MEARFTTRDIISTKACPAAIKLQFQQAKRRKEALEIQQQKRQQEVNERRNFEDNIQYSDDSEDCNLAFKMRRKKERYALAKSMMISEWMFEVPEDIEKWIAIMCPRGKRCLIIAQSGKTVAINKVGKIFNNFSSLLPFGHNLPGYWPPYHKRTVLDCLFNYELNTYYVLDIIEWTGISYIDYDAEFRFYFIQSKLCEIPGINEKSSINKYSLELAPRMITGNLYQCLLEEHQFFPQNVQLDGINFYHPESLYSPECTPLVLWLKPFMVPEVLHMPINDQLARLDRPPEYINIYEYSQWEQRKSENKKMKTRNKHSMQVDISVEDDDNLLQ